MITMGHLFSLFFFGLAGYNAHASWDGRGWIYACFVMVDISIGFSLAMEHVR